MTVTGRIEYYPTFNSLVFNETDNIEITDTNYFNFGTNDFRIAMLFYPDITISVPATNRTILCKYDLTLANDTGWYVYYGPSDGTIGFAINDGDVAQASIDEAGNITNDSWNYVAIEADRSGNCYIYVNGALATQGDISSKAGSINNASKMYFDINNNFKGRLGYLSIISGSHVIFGSDYALIEYDRMISGWPRPHKGSGGTWNFAESLTDEAGVYTWTHSGTPSYYGSGYPSQVGMSINYRYDYEQGFLPLDTQLRTMDGTAKVYQGGSKRRIYLSFIHNDMAEKIAIEGAWVSRTPVYLWLDYNHQYDLYGYIVEPPTVKEIAYGIYEYSVEFEEA